MPAHSGLVIVADDDEDIREILRLILETERYRVVTAVDGLDAWEQLTVNGMPSLILLDLTMPRLDGRCFIKRLRASVFAAVPVVVVSGNKLDRDQIAELNANGFLEKPVELEELLKVIRQLVPNPCAA